MKKGNRRPNCQTRWVMSRETGRFEAPPAFIKVEFFALRLDPVEDPDFVPIVVNGDDCTFGRYSYETTTGGNVWAGTWENFFGGGDWHYSQQVDNDLSTIQCFILYHGHPEGGFFIARDSAPKYCPGNWDDAFVDNHGAGAFIMPSYPWVFLDFQSVRAVTYAEAAAAGLVPSDTRAKTFFHD